MTTYTSIEEALVSFLKAQAALTNLVSDRIYPLTLPMGVTLPAITYQEISTTGSRWVPGHYVVRFQLNIWTTYRRTARQLEKVLREILSDYQGSWTVSGQTYWVIYSEFAGSRTGPGDVENRLNNEIIEFLIRYREL